MLETIIDEFTGAFTAVPVAISATRLIAALGLGAVIGLERELREKDAGLRTNMLVSIAACLFVIVGIELSELEFGTGNNQQHDPLRLIKAVTAGVAFLAAGLIFTADRRVRNVTTGATLWLAGAIGLACGAGQVPLAAMATLVVLLVLMILRQFEKLMGTHHSRSPDRDAD